MKRKDVFEGIMWGIVTGFIVTVIDGFFMLRPNIYTPPEYPMVLLSFNLILWTAVGCMSGIVKWLCVRGSSPSKNEAYDTLFFLVPFAAIYGVLGRLYLPHMEIFIKVDQTAFDKHLSFVWVGLFVLLLFLRERSKQKAPAPRPPLFFIPELLVIIALFQFCSNPECLKFATLAQMIQTDAGFVLKAVFYALGIAIIFLLYGCYFIKIRPKFAKILSSYHVPVALAGILFCGIVYGFVGLFMTSASYTEKAVAGFDVSMPQQLSDHKAPNVILIVFDTLRASAVRALQGSGFMDNIDALAADSMVFENCVAASYFTFPSHASLFTGTFPSEHGCERIRDDQFLADDFVTLAEQFKGHGYRTAAVVSNYGWVNEDFNMLQGFEFISSLKNIGENNVLPFRPVLNFFSYVTNLYAKSTVSYRLADDINITALEVTEKLRKDPFFLFLNYMDTHTPYRPPSPYDSYFLDQPNPQVYRLKQYYLFYRKKFVKEAWDSYLLSQYHGELSYLDMEFGRLVKQLKEMGLYDESLIIVTSDHGEVFGEHGFYSHYSPMHEGIAKVPLFIKFPGQQRTGSTDKIINLVDLYPTILSLCNMAVPKDISGVPFGDDRRSGFAGVTGQMVYYKGEYKYMDAYEKDGSDQLFHIPSDQGEKNDLSDTYPDLFDGLKKNRETLSEKYTLRYVMQPQEISEEARKGLRSLGYIQ